MQRNALCRSRRELSNAYLLAKFGFDTAENEPSKVCRIPRRRTPWRPHRTSSSTRGSCWRRTSAPSSGCTPGWLGRTSGAAVFLLGRFQSINASLSPKTLEKQCRRAQVFARLTCFLATLFDYRSVSIIHFDGVCLFVHSGSRSLIVVKMLVTSFIGESAARAAAE